MICTIHVVQLGGGASSSKKNWNILMKVLLYFHKCTKEIIFFVWLFEQEGTEKITSTCDNWYDQDPIDFM